MKNLYKYLAPFLADTFGFQEIIDVTDGMGILDDCSTYKGKVSRTDIYEPYGGSNLVTTWIRMGDVISGTKSKILETFRSRERDFEPSFVLVSTAPVSMMIGTDMSDVADAISNESGLPAAAVELGGHKFYDHGISETLLAMAKLLVEPAEKIPGTINLIGGNAIDWTGENVRAVTAWAQENGYKVISVWGGHEVSENLKQAAKAEINVVTAVSGMTTARWLEKEFGTPYVTAVPFGKSYSQLVLDAIKTCSAPNVPANEQQPKVLIIGEQLMSNAIRATLNLDYGIDTVQVVTFFSFDKTLAQPLDKRIKGEDGLIEIFESGVYDLVIADPDLRVLKPDGCKWFDLPHGAVCYEFDGQPLPVLVGEGLNNWLDKRINK